MGPEQGGTHRNLRRLYEHTNMNIKCKMRNKKLLKLCPKLVLRFHVLHFILLLTIFVTKAEYKNTFLSSSAQMVTWIQMQITVVTVIVDL